MVDRFLVVLGIGLGGLGALLGLILGVVASGGDAGVLLGAALGDVWRRQDPRGLAALHHLVHDGLDLPLALDLWSGLVLPLLALPAALGGPILGALPGLLVLLTDLALWLMVALGRTVTPRRAR